MIAWKTQAQALISSKTRRNEGSGAMHMVRYVSRKGSQTFSNSKAAGLGAHSAAARSDKRGTVRSPPNPILALQA
jgi:hypothetical protein